jgi:hypothetical protein
MKCSNFIILNILVSILINAISSKWRDTKVLHNNIDIRLIIHESVSSDLIGKLLDRVERSFLSMEPSDVNTYQGYIKSDDIILVSKRLLMWFSLTSKRNGRIVRSGGGLLAGVWEIEIDSDKNPKFKKEDPKTLYIQNLLLAGSEPGIKLFGSDVFGGYANNKVVWGIEYADDVRSNDKTGKEIFSMDRGAYSPDEGVFIVTNGILGNSGIDQGIESSTDTDPRIGVKGLTHYTLTYRIPANRLEFINEVELEPKENNLGPISNAFIAMYLPGYTNKHMVYAANPELLANANFSLDSMKVNKWFRNSAVKRTYFYDITFTKHEGSKYFTSTAPGNGRILCIGSPEEKIGFFCGYPNNDYIPQETYEEYVLEISDNQKLRNSGKFHTLNYKLLSSDHKTLTISKGQSLTMVMRYKLINTVEPMPEEEDPHDGKEIHVK